MLLIDDGSSDGTEEFVKAQYRDQQNLNYFYKQNEERGAARNFGIKKAKGNYIVFIDSDDLMHENHLETLVDSIRDSNYPSFIATKYNILSIKGYVDTDIQHLPEGSYNYSLLLKGNPFFLAIFLYKKKRNISSYLRKIGQ